MFKRASTLKLRVAILALAATGLFAQGTGLITGHNPAKVSPDH